MIFRMDYSIPVENVSKAQERFATMEEKWDGLKLIGRWHEACLLYTSPSPRDGW